MSTALAGVITAVVMVGIVLAILVPIARRPRNLTPDPRPSVDAVGPAVVAPSRSVMSSQPAASNPVVKALLARVALVIAIGGQIAACVAVFLPADQTPPQFNGVQGNLLIEHNPISTAVTLAVGVYFVFLLALYTRRHRRPDLALLWPPIVLLVNALLLLSGSTVTPVSPSGTVVAGAAGVHAHAGLGVYVLLCGAVLVALGTAAVWLTDETSGPGDRLAGTRWGPVSPRRTPLSRRPSS